MNDAIVQNEVVLNFLNTLFSKAMFFKDDEMICELNKLRHHIYYEKDFDYELILSELKVMEVKLKRYE